jgi:signal transduction histidine kinase/DNA-binding response OmpR family regulator
MTATLVPSSRAEVGHHDNLPDSAGAAGTIRFGVAFRLLGALLAIIVFATAISATALYTFAKYGDGFNRIATSSLPALIAASDLAQRSQALAANAPNLALADGHFARQAVSEALRGQLQAIAQAGERVKALAPETEGLDRLIQNENSLKETLKKLDGLVAEKLEADRLTANLMPRLRVLSGRIQAAASDLPSKMTREQITLAQIDDLNAWTAAAEKAIVIMLSTSSADTTVRVNRLRSEFEEAHKQAETARGLLSSTPLEAVDPLQKTLAQYGLGSSNIFDVRTAQLASTSAVHGALLETNESSAQFVTSAESIFMDIQRDVRAQSDFFGSLISKYSRLFTIFSLLCVAGACGLFLYINRSIVQRLRKLSESMRGSVDGRTAAISIAGSDEIADMAKAADFFITSAQARTRELAQSVEELRALDQVTQAVNSSVDLETVLATIVAKATQLSGTEAGAIYVLDDAAQEFRLRSTYGLDDGIVAELKDSHIRIGQTAMSEAAARRVPIQVPDIQNDPSATIDVIIRAGFRALLFVPLLGAERIVGALVVRRKQPGEFPKTTVELLQTFAAQSVLAFQNARLFSEIEKKSQQLETANQHKSQFLANMSHELRTPLNAIIGYSEILQEDVADLGRDNLVPDLRKIEGAGRHLLSLINDILDLSKVEAGRMDIFLEDVEIVPLLEEVRAIIVPLAEKNGNAVEYRVADNLGSMRTDRTKLKQSLLNILSNANKFTENGRVTLVTERIENGQTAVRFAISDTGIGMSEEQLGRLFQAFSQAETRTSQKYGGTGLGLVITRNFCQLLGGEVTVASKPGEGSTFTITLPDRPTTQPEVKSIDAPQIAGDVHATTVLVVDDDPAARDLLTANLKAAGYRLIHAASGTEALNLARMVRPDAITLDVLMPKPDGWDVLTALKADAQLRDIPVIMVTVLSERGIGLSLGAVEVLTKPVDRAQLSALMHSLLRREGPILVVEDDASSRELISQSVEKMGLAVAEAVNGRQALTWLGAHPAPAMILLDLVMPEVDGFEVLDALAARADWRDIPVIVITAKQLTVAERERLLRQAQKIIAKGAASRLDIAAAVGEALRRRPAPMCAGANA